jgi:hypothetical protein
MRMAAEGSSAAVRQRRPGALKLSKVEEAPTMNDDSFCPVCGAPWDMPCSQCGGLEEQHEQELEELEVGPDP